MNGIFRVKAGAREIRIFDTARFFYFVLVPHLPHLAFRDPYHCGPELPGGR
jgi:hypothetical protein